MHISLQESLWEMELSQLLENILHSEKGFDLLWWEKYD